MVLIDAVRITKTLQPHTFGRIRFAIHWGMVCLPREPFPANISCTGLIVLIGSRRPIDGYFASAWHEDTALRLCPYRESSASPVVYGVSDLDMSAIRALSPLASHISHARLFP